MITKIDPADWQNASTVSIESNAPDNFTAIDEIEAWAKENSFARARENWLRVIRRNDTTYFMGVCYRITEEMRELPKRILKRRDSMPTYYIEE